MNCQRIQQESMAERYLTGQLGAAEQEAYEQHYFGCAACFQELQIYRTAQQQLKVTPLPISRRGLQWAAAGLAAALLLGAILWRPGHPAAQPPRAAAPSRSTPAHDFTELARYDPPRYTPMLLRGADAGDTRFRQAMERYRRGQYAAAIPALQAVLHADPHHTGARFYLGACQLLTGDGNSAISSFQAVIAAGDTPYLDEAHFSLAKAYLGQGNAAAARPELQQSIQLHGDGEKEAQALLHRLPVPSSQDTPK